MIKASPTANYQELTVPKLLFAGAVEFGSRALNVDYERSDYDFAMLRSNFYKLMENSNYFFTILPIKNYFKIIPRYGKNSLIRGLMIGNIFSGTKLDILILEHQEHIDIIRKSVDFVKTTYSTKLLKGKNFRIKVYEQALEKYGFQKQMKYKIADWIIKHF